LDEAELLIKEAENKLSAAKLLLENGMYFDAISRAYYSYALLSQSTAQH
jgi:uncharacterized protein (UPF0332 family)